MRRLLLVAAIVAGCGSVTMTTGQRTKVCGRGVCFVVEVARTPDARAQGLMHRTALGRSEGMLFVFDEPGIYAFWMKDTLIPLDMIWLDPRGTIVFVKENALPCASDICIPVDPGVEALYVLEVNAGVVADTGLSVGDTLTIENE